MSNRSGPPSPEEHAPLQDTVVAPPSVLIVEDEVPLRRELVELVTALGKSGIGAGTIDEALAIARQTPIETVLCDYNLGSQNGLDLLRQLPTEAKKSRDAQLILMTGHIELTDSAYSDIHRHADALLMKPIALGALRAVIEGRGSELLSWSA